MQQQGAEEQLYEEARRILRALLMGMDPENHVRLSPECVVMQPEVQGLTERSKSVW